MCSYENWKLSLQEKPAYFPLITPEFLSEMEYDSIFFLALKAEEELPENLGMYAKAIVVLESEYDNKTQLFRKSYLALLKLKLKTRLYLKPTQKRKTLSRFKSTALLMLEPH